jgi:hypothetical protein
MEGAEFIMNGKKHGYGYKIDGEYKYGYSTRERAYSYMRRNKAFAKSHVWSVFKIDALGFHEIQRHYWEGRL